jgi:hypothetical protein
VDLHLSIYKEEESVFLVLERKGENRHLPSVSSNHGYYDLEAWSSGRSSTCIGGVVFLCFRGEECLFPPGVAWVRGLFLA